jgi:hypothetical protein
MKLRTYLILGLVVSPFLGGATAPAGCNQDVTNSLNAIHSDLANMETAASQSLGAACAVAPILQADVNAVIALSKLSAQQQIDIQSAQAVITTACKNPSVDSATIIANVGAAIAQVQAIQSGAAQ